jgi:drug/metabolite transporter (DMT)-like permease
MANGHAKYFLIRITSYFNTLSFLIFLTSTSPALILPSLSLAYAALSAMTVFWGLSFIATKVALETFPTFTLIFFRFALASCFFLFLLVRKGFPALSARDHDRIPAAKASAFVNGISVVTTIGAWAVLGERGRNR